MYTTSSQRQSNSVQAINREKVEQKSEKSKNEKLAKKKK